MDHVWTRIAVLLLAGSILAPAAALEYIESSQGLDTPALDGGRTELEMGDVNGDGNIDIVSIGDHGNPISDQHGVMVWFGDGRGRWQVRQYGQFGYGGIALGDVNGDGLLDVGYGMHHNYSGTDLGDQLIEVALGDGSGTFWSAWDDGLATNGETWGMFGTDFADVDGDGDLDLASVSFGCCSGVHVYLNQGDGSWLQSFGLLGGNSGEEIVFGDVNGDGWADFAAAHDAGTVYVGDGRGGFALADGNLPGLTGAGRFGIALGDVDRDGADDLAWVEPDGGPQVWSLREHGWSDMGSGLPASGPWQSAQLHDMDGDGLVDLALFGSGRFTLLLGDGGNGWTPASSFTTPSPGDYEAFRVGGDADHNGRSDIAIIADEGGFLNGRNTLRFFRETSQPQLLEVRIVAPRDNRSLRAGTVGFIDWASAIPDGSPGRVALAYSRNGAAGPWHRIAADLPDNGRYQWLIPTLPPSEDLRIAIVLRTAAGAATAIGPRLRLLPGHPRTAIR